MPDYTQFRTSLNGFNREDVVAFIDQMTHEHEEKVQQLQEKNTQLRTRVEELEQALFSATEAAQTDHALSEANDLLMALRARNEVLEKRVRDLEAAAQRVEIQEKSIPEAVDEISSPKSEKLSPAEQAKDYIEMELAAYRRAELAERRAMERANDIYRQIQTVFSQANSKLESGRSDLENLTESLNADFSQLMTLLTAMNSSYQSAEASFAVMEENNRRYLEVNG